MEEGILKWKKGSAKMIFMEEKRAFCTLKACVYGSKAVFSGSKGPNAPFDRYEADGFGSYNGVAGYQIHFEFTDAGEPGSGDHAFIIIHGGSPDTVVLNINGFLHEGNQQAHKA